MLAHSAHSFVARPHRLQRTLTRTLDGVDLDEDYARIFFFGVSSLMPKQKSPVNCEVAIGICVAFKCYFVLDFFKFKLDVFGRNWSIFSGQVQEAFTKPSRSVEIDRADNIFHVARGFAIAAVTG